MGKHEFIDGLRAALNGRIAPNLVIENVNYYEEYINTQIRMGQTEEEVLEALGDPRLIAKTIIATSGRTDNYQGGEYQSGNYRNKDYYNTEYGDGGNIYGGHGRSFRMPKWLGTIIFVLVLVLIIAMVFSMLSFLAPIIFPFLVVVFLVKLFRDWLN